RSRKTTYVRSLYVLVKRLTNTWRQQFSNQSSCPRHVEAPKHVPLEREKMADNKQNISYQAGQAAGQTKEKASGMMDKAKDAAASAQDSLQQTGQQMKQKAQGAADVVKDKTGLNKNT
ncbi:unnamed protein product, partial [Thlaspi arvense]